MILLKMGDLKMPLFEFQCPKHGVFECFTLEKYDTRPCPKCKEECEKIEFSVPARRNPEKGIQK
jgi:hypothetical protein